LEAIKQMPLIWIPELGEYSYSPADYELLAEAASGAVELRQLMLDTFQRDYIRAGKACLRTKDLVTCEHLREREESYAVFGGLPVYEFQRR
jgi:hypothetical protein